MWVIKVVMSHYSFNSSEGASNVFGAMFPDSEIAKQFKCSATKCTYIVSLGMAPYFQGLLISDIRKADCFLVSFDECLNTVTQEEQMDLVIRIWKDNQVSTRYFGSQFLKHTRTSDLIGSFKAGISGLNAGELLQISMDGPSTNWKFLNDLLEDGKCTDPDWPTPVNLGSFGLH